MSGAHRHWTLEQRQAQRERLALRRLDPEFQAKRVASLRSLGYRAYARKRQRTNRDDPDYNARHAAAMARPEVKSVRGAALRAQHDRPAFIKAKMRGIRARHDRLRGGVVPTGYEREYQELRALVGAPDALLLVSRRRVIDGPVPKGYQETYDYLRRVLCLSEADAKQIVHQQHLTDHAASLEINKWR